MVPVDESALDPDPLVQFRAWWEEARASGGRWADVMVLAAASPDGRPSARAVVLRDVGPGGFAFVTDTRSHKAADLAANPQAALVFLWPSTGRQVRVVGHVVPAADEDVEAWFAAQPREANLAAAAVTQDEVVSGPDELRERLAEVTAAAGDRPVGRPPGGGGYLVVPDEIELWQERSDHLHDRVRYRRDGAAWRREWLAP